MTRYHSDEYIRFLKSIRPDNVGEYTKLMQKQLHHHVTGLYRLNVNPFFYFSLVNVGEDCPVFDGLYEFCQLSAGGSIGMICVYHVIDHVMLKLELYEVLFHTCDVFICCNMYMYMYVNNVHVHMYILTMSLCIFPTSPSLLLPFLPHLSLYLLLFSLSPTLLLFSWFC